MLYLLYNILICTVCIDRSPTLLTNTTKIFLVKVESSKIRIFVTEKLQVANIGEKRYEKSAQKFF